MTEENIHIYETLPEGFQVKVEAVAIFLEVGGKLLFLKRAKGKLEEFLWGVPAGKVEKDEELKAAAQRELVEETGIQIEEDQIKKIRTLYIDKPKLGHCFSFHMYSLRLNRVPEVLLSDEHTSYCWVEIPKALSALPLMTGAATSLHYYQRYRTNKGVSINAYLILRDGDRVLLYLRENTGYLDGHYGLISGHVEPGESATDGIIREAFEEGGITISPEDLSVVHIMHRKSDRDNIDIFFSCARWKGEVKNREPEKCKELKFFALDSLPSNMIDYVAKIMDSSEIYSEKGWDHG